jgi:small-conductance mechanosensitive channel
MLRRHTPSRRIKKAKFRRLEMSIIQSMTLFATGGLDSSSLTDPLTWLSELMRGFGLQALATIVVVMLGWAGARIIRMAVIRGLRIARIDLVSERAGIDGMLRKGGIKNDSVEILGSLVYWILIIMVVIIVMKLWNLEIGLSTHLVPFLPKIFISLIVLILGLYLAAFSGDLVRTAAANADMVYAALLGQLVRYLIIIFVVLTAIQQLGIEAQLISWGFLMVVGSLCLGMALAIGLGARPIVEERIRKALDDYEAENAATEKAEEDKDLKA